MMTFHGSRWTGIPDAYNYGCDASLSFVYHTVFSHVSMLILAMYGSSSMRVHNETQKSYTALLVPCWLQNLH